MDTYHWLFTKNPNTDFSRKKKWSFEEVMKFIITMEGKSLKDELLEYFDFNNDTPSNSSFNQRRAPILPDAFEFLFENSLIFIVQKTSHIKAIVCWHVTVLTFALHIIPINTIFIADRGFESYNIFVHAEQAGAFYLIRAKDILSNGIVASMKKQLPKNQDIFDNNYIICAGVLKLHSEN